MSAWSAVLEILVGVVFMAMVFVGAYVVMAWLMGASPWGDDR